jgi:hypothetical protein
MAHLASSWFVDITFRACSTLKSFIEHKNEQVNGGESWDWLMAYFVHYDRIMPT